MKRIKALIASALLVINLISLNVCTLTAFGENETPILPIFSDDKNNETLDNNQTDDSAGNSANSGVDSSDNNSNISNSNGVGGNPYRPVTIPDNTTQVKPEQVQIQTENNIKTFADIKQDDWFYNDVMFVFSNNIMTGTGKSEFSPYTTLNRAMVITILHRIDGDNSIYEKNIFNDVEKNSWYEKAVNWGYKNKIITGTGKNTFSPMDNLTREQFCVMLYNYTKYIGVKTEFADISHYADNKTISVWAKDAVSWAVHEKIVTGKGNNFLAPRDSATRAEAATIIRRYIEKFAEFKE